MPFYKLIGNPIFFIGMFLQSSPIYIVLVSVKRQSPVRGFVFLLKQGNCFTVSLLFICVGLQLMDIICDKHSLQKVFQADGKM